MNNSQPILASFGDAWWHWLILALLLVFVGISFKAFQFIYMICATAMTDRLSRRMLRAAGRFMTRSEVEEKAASGAGTILVEFPLTGSDVTRAWWTNDDVLPNAPVPSPTHDEAGAEDSHGHPFDVWCHEKYTDPIHGSALLFAFSRGEEYARRLVEKTPTLKIVTVRTGWTENEAEAPPADNIVPSDNR